MVRGVGRRGVKKRSAGSSGIFISCMCVGSGVLGGGVLGKEDSGALKEEKQRLLVLLFFKFFVGEARTDWDFGFSMAFSTLL